MKLAKEFAKLKASKGYTEAKGRELIKSRMAEKPETVETRIPFDGFYDSRFSDIVDNWEERQIEYIEGNESDEFQPLPSEFGKIDYSHLMIDSMSYSDAYRAIAADYCVAFWEIVCEEFGIPKFFSGIEFSGMESPKYYNFETDRIFAKVSIYAMRQLRKAASSDPEKWKKILADRHKSRSGFISFYSHNPDEWNKSISEMDHNELETVILGAMENTEFNSDYEWDIYYSIAENDYEYCDSAWDYSKFKAKFLEQRAELISEKMQEFAENGDSYSLAKFRGEMSDSEFAELVSTIGPEEQEELLALLNQNYRCEFTSDMFANC